MKRKMTTVEISDYCLLRLGGRAALVSLALHRPGGFRLSSTVKMCLLIVYFILDPVDIVSVN